VTSKERLGRGRIVGRRTSIHETVTVEDRGGDDDDAEVVDPLIKKLESHLQGFNLLRSDHGTKSFAKLKYSGLSCTLSSQETMHDAQFLTICILSHLEKVICDFQS
jgi:hypothetical protein